MDITPHNALKIVNEINTIIEQKVNIMNKKGIIISSTDTDRVGQLHEGAEKVINERLEMLIIENDNEYKGTKKGINFPIIVNNKIAGVIGITGEYDDIERYAKLIKRLTEILLYDASANEKRIIKQNIISNYLYEWICRSEKEINQEFIARGLELNIDILIRRRIVTLSFENVTSENGSSMADHIIPHAERALNELLYNINEKNLMIKTPTHIVCCFTYMNDDKLIRLCKFIKETLEKKYGIKICMGIDEDCEENTDVSLSYVKAKKALGYCVNNLMDILMYKNLNYEIFSDEVSNKSKREFIHRVFRSFTDSEIKEAIYMIEALYRFSGSISLTSQYLHMHKNTLQYKLKKIYEKTGYDPRSVSESGIFQISILFFKQLI